MQIGEHLDPAALEPFDEEIGSARHGKNIPERFCAVYAYANRIHTDEEIRAIRAFCRRHGLKPVALGFQQRWLKHFVTNDPFSLLAWFTKADFVITDTFHGTIFSAKYARRFAVIMRESNRNKLGDLCRKLGVEDHVLDGMEDLERAYGLEDAREKVKAVCLAERARTLRYLSDAVGGGEDE